MAEIIELIAADYLHIMRWQVRFGELLRRSSDPGLRPALAAAWDTVAMLIDLHMAAEDEVCAPALYGAGPDGLALVRETREAHADIREIIGEAGLHPPGSPRWRRLVIEALAAWTRRLHREVYGPAAECRRHATLALRIRLGRQWRSFMDAQIRDRYPLAPARIPTCQLRQAWPATGIPRLADPAFAPLACICPACTWELDRSPTAITASSTEPGQDWVSEDAPA